MATAFQRYNDIKQELLENYDELIEVPSYTEDRVIEYAQSWVPVYYSDIIEEWTKEMPNDFTDSWKEFGASEDSGIMNLMAVDLTVWYEDMGRQAWTEIEEDKAEQEMENA